MQMFEKKMKNEKEKGRRGKEKNQFKFQKYFIQR